jgi:hypothetical protein
MTGPATVEWSLTLLSTIGAENLDVLRDSAFEIPKARDAGDFGAYLRVQLHRFFGQTVRLKSAAAQPQIVGSLQVVGLLLSPTPWARRPEK